MEAVFRSKFELFVVGSSQMRVREGLNCRSYQILATIAAGLPEAGSECLILLRRRGGELGGPALLVRL